MRTRNGLIALGAAGALLLPAAPAAAQDDCIYSGAEYVVDDTFDCVRTILSLLGIDLPPT